MSGLISGKLLLRQELETLTDGSDADALHAHPAIGGDLVHVEENLSGTLALALSKGVIIN
ncbi:hypothetical protein LCGC14_1412070, partial [marine sediment metagenome]